MIVFPLTAFADTSVTYCDGEAYAISISEQAIRYGELSGEIVNTLVDVIMEYDGIFTGSSTTSFVKSIAISVIRGMLDDAATENLIIDFGFDISESFKDRLAEEAYFVACVYYDELYSEAGNSDSAGRLASIEMIRFALCEIDGYEDEQARKLAPAYYDIYSIYVVDGENAAVSYSKSLFAKPHQYGSPDWMWNEAHDSATARFSCVNCGYTQDVVTRDISTEVTEASCYEDGLIRYSATVTIDDFVETSEITELIVASHLVDGNNDHKCDWCQELISDCIDENPEDGICDICEVCVYVGLVGDANGDGSIDVFDANLVISFFYGDMDFTAAQLLYLDVNADGVIDIFDANLIVSYFYGVIDQFAI